MGTVEKLAAGVVAIGLVTTLLLPDRLTVQVIRASSELLTSVFRTVMGRGA